jgi:hypothetical protein
MIRGVDTRFIFDASGALAAIQTRKDDGFWRYADPSALEHRFCDAQPVRTWALETLDKGQVISPAAYLLNKKRLTRDLWKIKWYQGEGWAAMGFAADKMSFCESDFFPTNTLEDDDPNAAALLGEDAFLFAAKGQKHVEALREFYAALRMGHICFSGLFSDGACDLALADTRFLTSKQHEQLVQQTQDNHSQTRIKAFDDAKEFEADLSRLSGLNISAIWVVWSDDRQIEVNYRFNPGNSSDCCNRAERGVYTRKELLEWARSKCSYRLMPQIPN